MARSTLKLIPGTDLIVTPVLNEAALSQTNLIRFLPDRNNFGLPQKLGGWVAYYNSPIQSTVRALKGFADLDAVNHLAIGATNELDVLTNGSLSNITPYIYTDNPAPNYTTSAGSSTVTVSDSNITTSNLDYVEFVTPVSVGGIVLTGPYNTTFVSSSSYTITAGSAATSNVSNGGSVYAFTSGSGSQVVSCNFPNHGYSIGTSFYIGVSTSVGGINLFGLYTVLSVTDANNFTFNSGTTATSTAGPVSINAGNVNINYYVTGNPQIQGSGFGVVSQSFVNGSISGTLLTVASFASGVPLSVGMTITGSGIASNTVVTAYGTGRGGAGTYTVSISQTVSSTSITGTGSYGFGGFGVGVSFSSSLPGSPITAEDWSLDNFGQDLVACPAGGAIYYWQPNGSFLNAQLLGSQVPLVNDGIFIAMPQRQVVAWGSSFTLQQDPLLIRWSDVSDFTTWIGTAQNQAGSFRIPTGSKIVTCVQAAQQGLIWTDLDLWSMQYIGAPLVYGFNKIGANCGAISRKCVGQLNNTIYWMSQKQFFMNAGQGPQPMPCPVWDVLFQNLNTGSDANGVPYTQHIRCAVNSQFNEITWYYPSVNSTNGENDSYVKFNMSINQWDYGSLGRTAWIDQSVLGPPIGAGTDNYLYQHEIGNDAASGTQAVAMNSSFQTGYFEIADADNIMFVDQVWPDMKWGTYSGNPNATVQMTFYGTNYPGDTPIVYGPYLMTQQTEYISTRIRARLIAINVSSNDVGTFWRLGGIRYRSSADGKY